MNILHLILLLLFLIALPPKSHAMYVQGCEDPQYHAHINSRFATFAQNNKRMYTQTLRDYERIEQTDSATRDNAFQRISALTRHLTYSAQLDPIQEVGLKIDALLSYSESLSMEKRIAGLVLDEFSSENHAINMARAWIAYRQGDLDATQDSLMASLDIKDPLLLSAFGPDFSLVRHLYKDGHIDIVKAFINKTKTFWLTSEANRLRFIWGQMMILHCPIQFESNDIVQALNLGIRTQR